MLFKTPNDQKEETVWYSVWLVSLEIWICQPLLAGFDAKVETSELWLSNLSSSGRVEAVRTQQCW